MEAAAKSIESLSTNYLPSRPHHLSVSATTQYRLDPRDTRLEEDAIRPLQYMTFLHDVDRGVLLTRAYFDIRKDPEPSADHNAPSPPKPRVDPNKPVTKLSLKDYKNRKKDNPPAADANSSNKQTKPAAKEQLAASRKDKEKGPALVDEMLRKAAVKKPHPSLPPKPDVRYPGSASPDKKKRASEATEDRQPKRNKVEGSTANPSTRLPKNETPNRVDRPVSHDKKLTKELKPSLMSNGRSALSNSSNHGASPRPSSQLNGSQKSVSSNHSTPKKERPTIVPPLLSPLGVEGLNEDESRLGHAKKASDKDSTLSKSKPKRPRDEPDPSTTPKPRLKIPELLSPTLPAVVREALAAHDQLTISKTSSQKSSVHSDSPGSAKKAPVKTTREDTIYVDSKKEMKEESPTMVVTIKYPKRVSKRISRLLALAPKRKTEPVKKDVTESIKKEERTARDRSDSLEPYSTATARKRPRAATDVSEQPSATKRPRTSEIAQPSTPSKHAATMQRVASSSSQAGTPGVANNLTPAPPTSSDRRQTPVDPEKANRLKKQHTDLMAVGTKLKRRRDAIMKPRDGSHTQPNISSRDRNLAAAAGIQSTVAYMTSFKANDDAREIERKQRDPSQWRTLIPLLRVYRHDCSFSEPLSALILRLHALSLGWHAKSLWTMSPDNANAARELFQNMKDQEQTWKIAGDKRKSLGAIHNESQAREVRAAGKLIDQLGQWSTSEDVVPVTLNVLREVIRLGDDQFTAEPELVHAFESMANGS